METWLSAGRKARPFPTRVPINNGELKNDRPHRREQTVLVHWGINKSPVMHTLRQAQGAAIAYPEPVEGYGLSTQLFAPDCTRFFFLERFTPA